MEENRTEVVIVGAGPAGAICAYLLQKAGKPCVLVDHAQFPREKVCGGGLTPKAYQLLAELMPGLQYEYRPVNQIQLTLDFKPVVEFDFPQEIRVVKRKDFDYAVLQQYLEAGGEFVQDAFVKFEEKDGQIHVHFRSGREITCKYLVGADGATSRIRNQLLGPYQGNILFLEQYMEPDGDKMVIDMSREYKCGYYYLFPSVGRNVIGLGHKGLTPKRFREFLQEHGIEETQVKGANIPVQEVESGLDKVMLIGDAGGFPNKLTLEGLFYAIATGRNAAQAVIEGKPFIETNADIFRRKRKERVFTGFLYSSIGLRFIHFLTKFPGLIRKYFIMGLGHK